MQASVKLGTDYNPTCTTKPSSKHNYMSGYYSRDACWVCREEMHKMGLSFNDSQMQLQHNILYPTTPVWRLLSQKRNLYIYCNLCIQNEEVPLVLGWTEDNIHACIYLCPRDSALMGKGYQLALAILKLLNVLLLYHWHTFAWHHCRYYKFLWDFVSICPTWICFLYMGIAKM
jgi:hypothetical protein